MSDSLRDQMRLMVAEGYWGEVRTKRRERWHRK